MEDENDIERAEFVSHNAKVQTDNYRVKNDPKLEDEEGGDLLTERLFACSDGRRVIFLEVFLESGPIPRSGSGRTVNVKRIAAIKSCLPFFVYFCDMPNVQ